MAKVQQIRTEPPAFGVAKVFGPFTCFLEMPGDILQALINMTDEILEKDESRDYGEHLVSAIRKEKQIYKTDCLKHGVSDFLETAVRNYVGYAMAQHTPRPQDTYLVDTRINSAWIVSQYENEFNPAHSHNNCEISAVAWLKIPDVKGRRDLPSKNEIPVRDGDIDFIYSSAAAREFDVLSKGLLQLSPSPGEMLLFPSNLMHTVYPFIGEGERRSISFNANYQIVSTLPDENPIDHGVLAGCPGHMNWACPYEDFGKERTLDE